MVYKHLYFVFVVIVEYPSKSLISDLVEPHFRSNTLLTCRITNGVQILSYIYYRITLKNVFVRRHTVCLCVNGVQIHFCGL